MDKIEGPCIDIGEEDKKVKHVEAMEDGDGEVEGKPKSIEKEFGGPKKYEEGETKIEESVELGTSKEVSSFEPSSSQGKESLSQTADPTINNLDNPETGEGVQDKRNTEDIATATHETQEKQTEEMYSQQVDKPDVCMVSETESEENVNKSPPGEVQNLILEKTAEAGSSEGENIEDEMKSEQNHDGLVVKHEENKQSMHQGLAMADESTDESRDMEIPTVIAAENNSSDAVPITITAAQDHSVIADEDKIMDVVANIVPDHGKEEMSKYEDQIRETFVQQDEAGHENENSLALISREIDTATSTECSEAIASAKEETPIKITGEDFEDKKEEKPIDTDAVVDSGLPIEKGLPPTDLNEKVEDAGIELQYKNSSELHISHSLEQETMPVQGEKKPEDSGFEPQEQDHEANGQSKDLEKHAEDASEARESMQNTDLENPSGEGAVTAEVNSKADEMAVEREEKVNELESEEKLAIDDAGTNFKEEMQKKEEAHDEQTYEMATSDRIEKVTSDEVCSREFVDEKVERGVQAAGFQEAEIPLKNGVEESYEISSSVNEEVIDEPKIKDVEEVIDEEKIKDEATQLSSELVFEEKIVESSPDKETETEMSKGDDVEEQMMEDNNAKVILRESIQEASVNDCKNEGKNAEKSCREIYEVSEVEKKAETNINDEIPDVSLQASLLKEQESLQTENLTAEPEEKDEDGSSIRKDEDEENNNGLKEVKECSEKETLKGEEDGEQILPKNESGENLERSASMVSSGTGDVALNETTQKTEEEIDEGVEGIKKEAEIGKEDGEEQAIDENDDESIQVESIKEVPVSMVPNDENNAEEFEGEIFEESVTAGTNVSFTDATHQNDGAPSAVLETSTVKQMEIVQGEDKDTAPAEASPEEEEEHDRDGGLKRFEDNSSEIRLEGDPKKSDEETSRTIDAVAHEINQHIELPNSTLETSPVEEQASLKTEDPTPAENSPEGKKYEDGSSNKKDEDKEMNTGIAEEKAEENLEQILQNSTLVENPKQPINMICAETEADASSKMVDNREEEIVEIPRENAEAELLKEETIEGNVVEERNINSLSRESDEESPIKDFQNSAKSYERSTEEMLESQIAGGDETRTNDEDCNSSLTVFVDKIDESFKGDDENITPVEASPQDEKEEHGSFNRADDGNDNNPELIVTNQDSSREALKVEEDFEQELQSTEPGEHEESSAVMAAETEAGTLSDKIDDITGQEEVVTIHNIEESMEKEEHGSSDKEGEGNDSNPDLTVANQESVRETSEVQDDSEKELPRIERGEPEEPSTIMASETEVDTLSDKIDGITGQEEAVTVQNIEETVEKEEHGSSDKEGEENDRNLDLTMANQDSVREALEVQDDFEKELQSTEPGEPEEPSTIMASETEASTLSDNIDDITSQEEAVTIHNIEETMEKEEHESSDKEGEGNDINPNLTVAKQESVREASEVQGDSEQELPRIEPEEPEESSTIMASETEVDTLSDKIDDITGQEKAVTIHNIEETMEKEEHGSLGKEGEGNDNNPNLTVANQDSLREVSEVQDDSEKELLRIERGEPEEPSTIMASENEADTLSDKIDGITGQEEAVTVQNIEETVEKEEHGSSDKEGEENESTPDLTVANQDSVREASEVQDDSEKELPRIERGEPEEPSTIMASETEADTLSDKIDGITGQEEAVTVQNIEETVEKEEHGSSDKEGEENDRNLDLTMANQDSVREALEVQDDFEKELQSTEPGEPEEPSTIMASETEASTLSDNIDDITSQEEAVTIHNIEETVEKEEHESSDKEGEGNDINPNLTVANQESVREASEVQGDSEQELPRIEPEEPEESSTIMASETEADTLSDKIDGITGQEEAVTIQNIEETVEKEEHGSSDKEGEENESTPDLTVANQDSVREASEVQDDSEKELPRIERGEPEEPSTIMASETEVDTLSDKIDGITGQEEAVTVQNIEETVEKEEHGSSDKEGEENDRNLDLTMANQDSVREALEVQDDFEKELQSTEPGEPEEPSTIMASETEASTLSDNIDDITSQEEAVTIHNIEETMEKEEHESSDKEGEGNDINPNLTVAKQESVREASEVQGDSEQELPRIEPEEPEESSTIMASETEADTLSDKIDGITGQEEAVTVQNIEETVEKEEHGSLGKEGEGNDNNPNLTVANQDSVREVSEVQDDSEKELLRIEPGEPEEPSTIMASETDIGTLSDKIDDITSQEEAVTIHNIEETVEKEEHGSSDKEGEGNDSNLDLTVANQDSVREASEVQSDAEQELPRIEPEEDPKESSTIMTSETETDTMNDKIDDIIGQEEVLTIHNIEETVEKEKKEGSEDVDVTKVERAVMEEDLKLVAEASDANISVENDAEESIISGGKEVETVEKTFRLDFIQKLEVEEKREHKIEETKDEDIKKVQACGDTKLASLSVDTEKYVTAEEHTNTNISPHTTGETTTEEKAETMSEMEESVITSVDKDAEKKVTEEESAINDQSRIIYKGDESGMLVEHEVHEIIKDNNEVPLNSTSEENPLHKETEDESDEVKPNNEVKDSKSEFTEPFEARGLVEIQEFETLRGKQGPSSDIYLEKASEGVSEKESSKSLNEISCLESESKGEILEEVQPDVNDSRSTLVTRITGETSSKEAEPEDKRQIESFEPAPQEKGPVTGSMERSTCGSMDIDAEPEDVNFIENEDHRIPAASETEELENEMHKETPLTGSEDYEETTNETPLGIVSDDKQEECSAMLPEEPELKTNEGNMAADENPTTYENIETPQTPPQEIEIMLNEDMPINERDASKSVDPRKESIKKDEYSSNVGDEAIKCIEATSAERKEVILEEDNPTKKPEDSLTENVEANKTVFELEERTNNQEQAIGTEDYGVLPEENFEVFGKKLEGVSETETGDQSNQNIPEAYSGTVENSTEIQNKSFKSIEQSSQESQEVQEETSEKTELRFETEGDVKETQNTNETVKDVLLTEEVHEKVDEAGGETLKSTEKDVNDTLELCAKSTEDVRVHEVNESSLIAGECHDATESNEQTTIIRSDFQEAPTLKEMSLAKAITDEDYEMPAVLSTTTPAEDNEMTGVLSTTTPAEELDEMIKVIKEEDNCRDKIKATAMVEITETSLEEAQLDEKPVQVSNITSNDSVSLEIEAEACQEEKVKDDVRLELPSLNLASQIPIDDHKNILREQVAKENTNADDVQEDERASGVVYESKDHCIEELITSKIKEENEKSSEIDESPGAEAATNEAAIDQNPPEVISKEEQGISATTERREENMKGVEFQEDDLRKTEDVSLQKDDDNEERDISQLELQPNKDIQNQSPNEVLEEECETPGETKEEIKEGPKLVSMTNSQGFEALKDDESTSGHTVPEEKSEEQNQTPAVALLSKEKDCGTEMIMENIEEYVHVELPADPHNYSPPKITEDISELDVSGLGAKLNTGIQKDSLNEVQVEESKIPDDASKLQIPEYETSKEAFESMPEVHGFEGFTASEETEIKEKHVVVAITDLAEEENRGEKLIDSAEIMHDGVIEEGTFEGTSNLRTELSKEAVKSVSEVHGHEVLAESDDTEIKVKHPEVTTTDMAAEENLSERTIDAAEIIHDKLESEEVTKRETQQIMEERENAKNDEPVDLGEETTKDCQEEYELKAEESLGDNGTQKDIQNEELYKEVEKADENERTEKKMDTERIIEHLHLAAAENETVKESFLDEAGSEMHLENQICGTASGNDGRTETANVKEEEMDVEISQKEGPSDLVEASEATRDIHEEEETSKTTTEHIEEHAKEVEIEVDELPSAAMTAENTCSQKEETKEQEVCGSGVECNIDMQKNDSNEFDEETDRTTDEDSTMEPQGYENKIKDKEYLPESNKMTEITETTGSFEKTSDLRAETSEDTSKSVSEVHELEVLAESEHAEIEKEKHTEVAVTDLVAGENQNKKTIDATEVVHDELTNEEDKQHFKEGKEDTENCKPINLGEEKSKESHQIYDLKAEKSHEDKMENEIQNEEEFGAEISEKESLQDPAEANETTQDIHQGERDSDSTSEKPVPVEAETQETTERKKDAPQGLLQEPIVEATQGAEVGESEPGKATGIVDAQGFEPRAEIDEKNVRGNDESMSANISLFDMMQNSTRELQVKGDLTEEKESNEETRFEGEKTKSDEEKEEEGEEHKTTDSPVMVEASRDTVDVKVASKKHHSILSGVGSKVKQSISKVKKAITGKSSLPKQHSPK
ncbi:microtubule-associated protein [Salix suchowensis]|nr:microtubule-associated protein [Salix suchowensis]